MYHCDVTTLQRLETLSDEENVFYENQFERISFHFRRPYMNNFNVQRIQIAC